MVLGAGLVGVACAWLLQRRGHRVLLVDPALAAPADAMLRNGSRAALGVLMGQVAHRGSGRGWRLRQQSLALWRSWRADLARRGYPIAYRPGLLMLAASGNQLEHQQRLALERQRRGLPLELWSRERVAELDPVVPAAALGGLFSPDDGQLDPGQALDALLADANAAGLRQLADRAVALEPLTGAAGGWRLQGEAGHVAEAEWVVLAAGAATPALLARLGDGGTLATTWPMQPVLGQALELELPAEPANGWRPWPGAVVWEGINLIPRPDRPGGRRLWLGATLEPGREADGAALDPLRSLGGHAPAWLRAAVPVAHWQGLRARPDGRPAPLLEPIAPGLLLAGGHYRNGVLLAPASATWAVEQVEGKPRCSQAMPFDPNM
jgi:glycine/D-amino acid oxidase-like deaminating enzyme